MARFFISLPTTPRDPIEPPIYDDLIMDLFANGMQTLENIKNPRSRLN